MTMIENSDDDSDDLDHYILIVIITMIIHDGDVQVIVMIDGPHDARNEGNHGNDYERRKFSSFPRSLKERELQKEV